MGGALFFVGIFVLIIVFGILSHLAAKRRREALQALADRLGLRFSPDKRHDFASRFRFLDEIDQGDNRYAFNILTGTHQGHAVTLFEYHYETHSTDSKGNRQTHNHYLTFLTLELPRAFPELRIAPEGLLSKFAQALGYGDIDFESAEFSRAFCVRSPDKKFAYAICHARAMEYLLAHRTMAVEIENRTLALCFVGELAPERLVTELQHLVEFRNLMPAYLLEG